MFGRLEVRTPVGAHLQSNVQGWEPIEIPIFRGIHLDTRMFQGLSRKLFLNLE